MTLQILRKMMIKHVDDNTLHKAYGNPDSVKMAVFTLDQKSLSMVTKSKNIIILKLVNYYSVSIMATPLWLKILNWVVVEKWNSILGVILKKLINSSYRYFYIVKYWFPKIAQTHTHAHHNTKARTLTHTYRHTQFGGF